MRLKFVSEYLSIKEFEDVTLERFTILTGINGSGKTHLLKAIEGGQCIIDDVTKNEIRYFSNRDFSVGSQGSLPVGDLRPRFDNVYSLFDGRLPGENLRDLARKIWDAEVAPSVSGDGNLFGADPSSLFLFQPVEDENLKRVLTNYRKEIEKRVFYPLSQILDGKAFSISVQRARGPLHNINIDDAFSNFVPENSNSGIISTSLGDLFCRYKVNQYRWARQEIEIQDSEKKFSDLFLEYELKYPKPWEVVNEIFTRMNAYSSHGDIFSFEVTSPENEKIDYRNVETFGFAPQILDIKTGEAFDFSSLSSGEMILAALCVAVLGIKDEVGRPRVLLFDEIDASLHPSMIAAMIDTFREIFVERGTAIIMATHSPTTVSMADQESVFLVEPKQPRKKVRRVEKDKAISILTEGLATITDAQIVFRAINKPLNILTEGFNTVHLKKLLELEGMYDVGVIEGLEDRSGKTQLQTHAELLDCVGPEQVILFVFDSDARKQYDQVNETDKIKKFIFSKRDNGFFCGGIENMYELSLLEPFLHVKTVIEYGKTKKYRSLPAHSKRDFESHIAQNAKIEDFVHFGELKAKILEILEDLED